MPSHRLPRQLTKTGPRWKGRPPGLENPLSCGAPKSIVQMDYPCPSRYRGRRGRGVTVRGWWPAGHWTYAGCPTEFTGFLRGATCAEVKESRRDARRRSERPAWLGARQPIEGVGLRLLLPASRLANSAGLLEREARVRACGSARPPERKPGCAPPTQPGWPQTSSGSTSPGSRRCRIGRPHGSSRSQAMACRHFPHRRSPHVGSR